MSYNTAGCADCMQGLASPIDLTSIGLDSIAETLKRLPEGDAVALLSQLPEDVIRKICKTGVSNEIQSYLPWIAIGGVALLLFFIMK